ncbi:hypothetical protein CCACVL1_01868, partial [Corchorus capsularis]
RNIREAKVGGKERKEERKKLLVFS